MKLVDNWKEILLHSHSMRASFGGLFCFIFPEILYGFFGVETSPYLWWIVGFGLVVYGALFRLVDQGISDGK